MDHTRGRGTHDVENEAQVVEVGVGVATRTAEDGLGRAPGLGVGAGGHGRGAGHCPGQGDVDWNRGPREVPDPERLLVPLHGVDAAALRVERVSIRHGVRSRRREVAAGLVGLL